MLGGRGCSSIECLCLSGAGMVVDWEQESGLLITSGDVRIIRIWDTDREMKVQVSGDYTA